MNCVKISKANGIFFTLNLTWPVGGLGLRGSAAGDNGPEQPDMDRTDREECDWGVVKAVKWLFYVYGSLGNSVNVYI